MLYPINPQSCMDRTNRNDLSLTKTKNAPFIVLSRYLCACLQQQHRYTVERIRAVSQVKKILKCSSGLECHTSKIDLMTFF